MPRNRRLITRHHCACHIAERPTGVQKLKRLVNNVLGSIGSFTVGVTIGYAAARCVEYLQQTPEPIPTIRYVIPDALGEGNDTGLKFEITDETSDAEMFECAWRRMEKPSKSREEISLTGIWPRYCSHRSWLFRELSKSTEDRQISI